MEGPGSAPREAHPAAKGHLSSKKPGVNEALSPFSPHESNHQSPRKAEGKHYFLNEKIKWDLQYASPMQFQMR
jgi:hypothetical protein